MKLQFRFFSLTLALFALGTIVFVAGDAIAEKGAQAASSAAAEEIELFDGMSDGRLEVKTIARSDRAARVIITNKLNVPVSVELPEAFAVVPALAQFGGGGGGQGGGGFGGGGGGGQQSGGGGFGGGGGGGGGVFSIPPEETGKINVAIVCLDHGLTDPSSSKPYKIVPAAAHVDRPAVIELLKAFGRGELDHGAAQAAAWNLNSDMSWDALAAKLTGTERNINRSPYFSREQIRAGMAYAQEAVARAQAAEHDETAVEESDGKASDDEDLSEERSTTDTGA